VHGSELDDWLVLAERRRPQPRRQERSRGDHDIPGGDDVGDVRLPPQEEGTGTGDCAAPQVGGDEYRWHHEEAGKGTLPCAERQDQQGPSAGQRQAEIGKASGTMAARPRTTKASIRVTPCCYQLFC
jgi:hypothetical protein